MLSPKKSPPEEQAAGLQLFRSVNLIKIQVKLLHVVAELSGNEAGEKWRELEDEYEGQDAAAEIRAHWKRALRGEQAIKLLFPSLGRIKAGLEHSEIYSVSAGEEESRAFHMPQWTRSGQYG